MSTLVASAPYNHHKVWMVAAILCSIPGIVWLISVGDLVAYFTHHLPQGQLLYVFSKLCGLYAYLFMTIQIVIGTLGRNSPFFRFHPRLGMLTTLTVLTHVALFLVAASLRAGHIAFDMAIPSFSQGFYKGAVSFGIIAACGLVLVLIATQLRGKQPFLFRRMHRLAFVVGALGWLHSFLIGTETGVPAVMTFYTLLVMAAGYFLLRKMLNAFAGLRK